MKLGGAAAGGTAALVTLLLPSPAGLRTTHPGAGVPSATWAMAAPSGGTSSPRAPAAAARRCSRWAGAVATHSLGQRRGAWHTSLSGSPLLPLPATTRTPSAPIRSTACLSLNPLHLEPTAAGVVRVLLARHLLLPHARGRRVAAAHPQRRWAANNYVPALQLQRRGSCRRGRPVSGCRQRYQAAPISLPRAQASRQPSCPTLTRGCGAYFASCTLTSCLTRWSSQQVGPGGSGYAAAMQGPGVSFQQ